MHRILAGLHRVVKYAVDLLPNLVFEKLGHAAIRSGSVVPIPFFAGGLQDTLRRTRPRSPWHLTR